jgi:NAD(P)-dependent dehydrogenase (short-subunit alcohol dehydrogenase family)
LFTQHSCDRSNERGIHAFLNRPRSTSRTPNPTGRSSEHRTAELFFSPGALPTDSLADPDLVSDIVVWLASDASSLITAAQIPADKGYLKI